MTTNTIPTEPWKGQILHSSYGYDMTINTYYRVEAETPHTVILQEVGIRVRDDYGTGAGRSIPDQTRTVGQPFRATRRNGYAVSKHIAGKYASPWKGKRDYYNTWD